MAPDMSSERRRRPTCAPVVERFISLWALSTTFRCASDRSFCDAALRYVLSPWSCCFLCHGKTWSAMLSFGLPSWYLCGSCIPSELPVRLSRTLCTLRAPPILCEPTWSASWIEAYWQGRCVIEMLKLMRIAEPGFPGSSGFLQSRLDTLSSLSVVVWRGEENSRNCDRTSHRMVSIATIDMTPPEPVTSLTSRGTLR